MMRRCLMKKMEKLMIGCTFFLGGTVIYSLAELTNDRSITYLSGVGLLALGLILMYLGVKSPDRER